MLLKISSPIFIILIFTFFLIIIIFILSHFECNSFKISKYTINNLKNSDKLSLIFISDFHNKNYGDNYQKLLNEIFKLNPHYIILGGDFIDFSKFNRTFKIINYGSAILFIQELVRFSDKFKNKENYNFKKIFFTFGNHELRLKDASDDEKFKKAYEHFINVLNENNIEIIDNKSVCLSSGISFSGLSLYNGYYYNKLSHKENYEHIEKGVLDDSFENVDRSHFNIVSFHKPDYFKDLFDYGFDLVLSGHNHGGIVRLPGIGSVFSPDFDLFPKYDYGRYDFDNKTLIVSSGLGEHFIKFRLNNMPEVCFISIE